MFNFRKDKMGFFNGLILMIIAGAAVVLSAIFLPIWGFGLAMQITLGTAWVLCIIMVLVRITVFKYQRDKAEREKAEREQQAQTSTQTPESSS